MLTSPDSYVGALPGLLVQGLRKVGTSNPLILLDELDKGEHCLTLPKQGSVPAVGSSSFHGDPSAALLETLDPAQNRAFHDHYLGDVPVDLSQVMFIATANTTDTISAPLLDRCEVIECSGYVVDEKLAIAKRFLLPKQAKENGLGIERISMMDDALLKVIVDYTREVSLSPIVAVRCSPFAGGCQIFGKRAWQDLPIESGRLVVGSRQEARELVSP